MALSRDIRHICQIADLPELRAYLSSQTDTEGLREYLLAEFFRYAEYRNAEEWNTAVRLCECLAEVGWGDAEPIEATRGVWVNGNPETYFVNRYGETRFRYAVWSKRKGGVAIDFGGEIGEIQDLSLSSQRNWIPKNPVCITRGIANCYENSRDVIESMERDLRPALHRRMRPELYGSAINRIELNCSFSFYDNYHCKTNYIIANESLRLKQRDYYEALLGMFSEKEIEDNGYYLRNRFTYGPFRRDTGSMRIGIVFEKEFSDMVPGGQKQLLGDYLIYALQQAAKRLSKKIDYDFCLMLSDFETILNEWRAKRFQ